MQEYFEQKQEQENKTKNNFRTPERESLPEIPKPSALITITVAEYHFLTKAATLLEVVLNDGSAYSSGLEAVRRTIEDMKRIAEGGAAE